MKTSKYFLMAFMALAMAFTACEETTEETCDSENFKDDFNCSADAVATFCSDGTNNSYYTYNGEKYECSGVDASTCEDAIAALGADLIADGCSGKKSATMDVKLSNLAQTLLSEVRTHSLE